MARTSALPPLITSLLKPDAYPHPADGIELIQTHISYVLLAGAYAYKIKKPASFGFVDYSTLELRRRYCEEEVQLNRRLCDDVYLGVTPIVRTRDGVRMSGDGAPEEYAVQMRRVPDERTLPRLIEHGAASDEDVRRVARTIAAFHASAERSEAIAAFGRASAVLANWHENFEQTRGYIGATITQEAFDAIHAYVTGFLADHGDLFERRADDGRVRDGHGDLRCDSIAIHEDGRICVMDCIEFSDRLRYGDVAADIGFLAMDLDARGRADLADELIGAYIDTTRDETLPLVLPFYRCYRTYVRGKVESFRSSEDEVPAAERDASADRARASFDLAARYASERHPPMVIVMVGLAGSGKSHLANALGGRIGAAIVSSDAIRREASGGASQSAAYGEGAYTEAVRAGVYAALRERAAALLAQGFSVILDATHIAREQRDAARDVASRAGARFMTVHVDTPMESVRRHFEARAREEHTTSDADMEVYLVQRARIEAPTEIPAGELMRVDGSVRAAENVARIARRLSS